MNDLISVIVPVYNVENYLTECIESIVNQTYKRIEIILVDDGSTDKSGLICDQFAINDSRIKVIHQENKGLSEARNTGISVCNGSYISLIDSDDFVEEDFIKILYETAVKEDADLVCFENLHFEDGNDKKILKYWNDERHKAPRILRYKRDDFINLAFYQKIKVTGAQQKLYKKDILKKIKFPKGKYFEDLAVLPIVLCSSSKISMLDVKPYAYRIRRSGIMNEEFSSKKLDCIWVGEFIYSFIDNNAIEYKKSISCAAFRVNRVVYSQVPKENKAIKEKIFHEIKKYSKIVINDKNAPIYDKILAFCSRKNMKTFDYAIELFNTIKYYKQYFINLHGEIVI